MNCLCFWMGAIHSYGLDSMRALCHIVPLLNRCLWPLYCYLCSIRGTLKFHYGLHNHIDSSKVNCFDYIKCIWSKLVECVFVKSDRSSHSVCWFCCCCCFSTLHQVKRRLNGTSSISKSQKRNICHSEECKQTRAREYPFENIKTLIKIP